MTVEERQKLFVELRQLEHDAKFCEFVEPKIIRRIDAIRSLLMTDGQCDDVRFKMVNGHESQRITSFTRDRR